MEPVRRFVPSAPKTARGVGFSRRTPYHVTRLACSAFENWNSGGNTGITSTRRASGLKPDTGRCFRATGSASAAVVVVRLGYKLTTSNREAFTRGSRSSRRTSRSYVRTATVESPTGTTRTGEKFEIFYDVGGTPEEPDLATTLCRSPFHASSTIGNRENISGPNRRVGHFFPI